MSQINIFEGSDKTDKACTFCEIIQKKNGYIVFQDDFAVAFLDKRPLFPGHCLLVPRSHYETLADLPLEHIDPLFRSAQILALAVEKSMDAEGTFVAINNRVSQSVPHLHIHIVPRRKKDGLKGFFWPRNPYKDTKEIETVQTKIRSTLEALRDTFNKTSIGV